MATTASATQEQRLPGQWRLIKASGWIPLGRNGRMIDTDGWLVVQPHVIAYANDSDRIQRAEGVARTPKGAVDAFFARYPHCAPKAD